jgi:hypothetical protein
MTTKPNSTFKIAINTIHHDAQHPSQVTLPLIAT